MKIRRSKFIGIVGCVLALVAFSLPVAAAHHEEAEHGRSHQKAKKTKTAVEMKEEAAEMKGEAKREASERAEEAMEDASERKDEALERSGDSRGAEMRERSDQRKAIMEESKSGTEPSERKGKKAWWKFWGSDGAE